MRPLLASGCVWLSLTATSPALADAAPAPPGYDVYVSDEGEIVQQIGPKRVVEEARIEERSARTLDEALAFEPGIYVRKGNEGTPRIDMRGLRSRHVLLLLDGIPFNSTEDGQFDPVLIPVELMQSVHVDFGNSSALYGDGPIGGVLQVVTRTPGFAVFGTIGSALVPLASSLSGARSR
jgi:vitamin B12 transporter